jgi:hypothetical protein
MPCANVDIFREKGAKNKKKSLGATDFYEKMGQNKIIEDVFIIIEFKINSL